MNLDILSVTGVWILITFIVTTSQYFVFTKYFSDLTVNSLLVYVIFNILCVLLCINYYLAIRTDAGGIPVNWIPDDNATVVELKKSTAKPRFCRTCQKYKPPRAHHCSTCQRCTLKMDHHCPWIGNCVGHFNHGHFVRFLIYVDLACGMCLTVLGMRTYEIVEYDYALYGTPREPDVVELIFLLVNLIATTIVLVLVGLLSVFHVWSIAANTTTIENWENNKIKKMQDRGEIREAEFPYNIGAYKNMCLVLGNNPLLWLWPQSTRGDGINYPVASHLTLPVIWPPIEYEKSKQANKTRREYVREVNIEDMADTTGERFVVRQHEYIKETVTKSAWENPQKYGTYGQSSGEDSEASSTLSDYGYRSSDLDGETDDDDRIPLSTVISRRQINAMKK